MDYVNLFSLITSPLPGDPVDLSLPDCSAPAPDYCIDRFPHKKLNVGRRM